VASPSDNPPAYGTQITTRTHPQGLPPYVNSLLIKMPPASRGASGAGRLVLPTFLPVGVLIALMRVPCHVCAHIVHAHDAQCTVLGSANIIVHVISAANAAAGAGGFGLGVLSGAHANIVTHTGECVYKSLQYFF
jgi:hypothetical protein